MVAECVLEWVFYRNYSIAGGTKLPMFFYRYMYLYLTEGHCLYVIVIAIEISVIYVEIKLIKIGLMRLLCDLLRRTEGEPLKLVSNDIDL